MVKKTRVPFGYTCSSTEPESMFEAETSPRSNQGNHLKKLLDMNKKGTAEKTLRVEPALWIIITAATNE